METITNVVSSVTSTASKLVYGDQSKAETDAARTANNETGGTEPVSGQQGSGTIAEPYDQGNAPTPLDTTANKSTFLDYRNNETGGQEPISGEQGKGTVTEPFDQGNTGKTASGTNDEFLKLNPTLDGPQADAKTESSGDPKIYTNRQDDSYTGMPIVPLNPDQATSGPGTSAAAAPASTGITDKAGVSEKVWKETPLDDISRAGAPGAGPTALDVTPAAPASSTTTGGDAAIKTSAPDAVTAASSTYGSGTSEKTEHTHGVDAIADAAKNSTAAKTQDGVSAPPNRDTPDFAKPDLTTENLATTKPSTDSSGIAGEKAGRKSESGKSPALGATTSNEEKEKDGKMSHLKEKLKNKLHIGSKDK